MFATKIEVNGDARTRTVSDNVIDLDGVKVVTSPHGVGVAFTCNYDSSVNVQSGPLTVQDVSIGGSHTSSGTLDGGFTLTAGDGTILLGDDIIVTAAWTLALSDVYPHYESCLVKHGTSVGVPIVKNGCMASTLGAEVVANPADVTNEVSIKYKTFSVEDESATTQVVTCTVKLCAAGNCARAAKCPTSTADTPYKYI